MIAVTAVHRLLLAGVASLVMALSVAPLPATAGDGWTTPPIEMDRANEDELPRLPSGDWDFPLSMVTSISTDTTFTTAGSPYTVTDTLVIENTADLRIQPGVTVKMGQGAAIIILGEFKCNGTAQDPIIFEPAQPGDRWGAIGLLFTNSTAEVRHTHFIGGSTMFFDDLNYRGQLSGYFSDVDIADCVFDDATKHHISFAGMTGFVQRNTFQNSLDEPIDSNFNAMDILDNVIYDAPVDAIDANSNTAPSVINGNLIAVGADDGLDLDEFEGVCAGNVIYDLSDKGISVSEDSNVRLENNIIWSCGQGFGITNRSTADVWNNSLVNNFWGMRIREKALGAGGATVTGANNLLWLNSVEIEVDAASSLDLTYSLVQGGYPGAGNIDADPLFVDPDNRDYHILPGSPCIDAGQGDGAPPTDIDGEVRVNDPDTPNTGVGSITFVDIGADEWQPEVTSIVVNDAPAQITLLRVAPHPIARSGAITVQLGPEARGDLKLYDVHGRMQRVWADVSGDATIDWDATDESGRMLAHGVYFLEYRHVDGRSFRSRVVVVP